MKTSVWVFHWLPRIICILAILLVSLFASDAFTSGLTILHQIGDFLIHLIPSFILLAVLIIAWKWELIGGIIFIIIGLALSPYIFTMNYSRNHSFGMSLAIILIITFPFIVAGILFIVSYFLKKKKQPEA
jgi:hypothetical protein